MQTKELIAQKKLGYYPFFISVHPQVISVYYYKKLRDLNRLLAKQNTPIQLSNPIPVAKIRFDNFSSFLGEYSNLDSKFVIVSNIYQESNIELKAVYNKLTDAQALEISMQTILSLLMQKGI